MNVTIKKEFRGGRAVYNITWQSQPVDRRVYKKIYFETKKSTNYNLLGEEEMDVFYRDLRNMNEEFCTQVTLEQALSIRSMTLKEKTVTGYSKMMAQLPRLAEAYKKGTDIMTLSHKYDYAPVSLLREILKRTVKKSLAGVFAGRIPAADELSGRDLEQFNTAQENDSENTNAYARVTDAADSNEALFVDFFVKAGINLKTQADISSEQIKTHGRTVATPDVFFTDIVYINGMRVAWIDFKNYVGVPINFIYNSNAGQISRYVERWGSGALCYRGSFVEGMVFTKTMLLDGGILGLNYKK